LEFDVYLVDKLGNLSTIRY